VSTLDKALLRKNIDKRYGCDAWDTLVQVVAVARQSTSAVVAQTSGEQEECRSCAKKQAEIAAALRSVEKMIVRLGENYPHFWLQGDTPSLISKLGAQQMLHAAAFLEQTREPKFSFERAILRGRTTAVFRAAVHSIAHARPDLHARFMRAKSDEKSVYMPEDVKRALCALTATDFNCIKQTVKTSGFENVLGLRRERTKPATEKVATGATVNL
jgi:hypothetical protein